jgi:hypothetical protein
MSIAQILLCDSEDHFNIYIFSQGANPGSSIYFTKNSDTILITKMSGNSQIGETQEI